LNRKIPLTLGLLAVFLLSACTPSASAPPPTPTFVPEPAPPVITPTAFVPAPTVEEVGAPAPTEIPPTDIPPTETPVIVPTSLGNQLVATDPGTVNISSGQPQLIEFFAFW